MQKLAIAVKVGKGGKDDKGVKRVRQEKTGSVQVYTEAEIAAITKAGLHKDHAAGLNMWIQKTAERELRGGAKAKVRLAIAKLKANPELADELL